MKRLILAIVVAFLIGACTSPSGASQAPAGSVAPDAPAPTAEAPEY